MMDGGYIVIARRIFDHPLLADGDYFRAWLWLISEAAWMPRRVRVASGRASELVDLGRGQLSHSRSFLAKAWGWSEKRVRTFLNRLEMDGMIGTQTGQLQTIITICNYDVYQFVADDDGRQTGQQTGPQRAGIGPEEKELKELKEEYTAPKGIKNPQGWPPDAFDRWYAAYPKKVEKTEARKRFDKLQASGAISFEKLMTATTAYADECVAKERQFIKGPAVWLNKGCYLDERGTGKAMAEPPLQDPRSFTEDDWRVRLAGWRTSDTWSTHWGPKPGDNGHLVPAHLLANGGGHA